MSVAPGLQVLGVGFGRTGTYTLKLALERLGYGPCYHMAEEMAEQVESGVWDLVVVDTPPSSGGIDFLTAPGQMRSLVAGRLLRVLKRWALMGSGVLVVLLGILIAPLPGPGGIPVIAVGLMLILRSSYWAKRQFIRAQHARPKWVYPFRRLMRRKPEIAPVFWQQALRAEKLVLRRRRRLVRVRKRVRRSFRKLFRRTRA